MCKNKMNAFALAPVQFSLSKTAVSMEVIRTTIDEKLKELGFESNYNNIDSDWHVYKTYSSDILVSENVIEFFDFIEADIYVYDRGDEYIIEVKKYAGNISEIELYVTLKRAFLADLPVEGTGNLNLFSKHFAILKQILLSILAFICMII